MIRPLLLGLAALAAGAPAASAATIASTPHGPVDLGDRVAFTVSGERCERVGVAVRLLAGPRGEEVRGPRTTPRETADGECRGAARVPEHGDLVEVGWRAGDRLDIALDSSAGEVPLRHARMEADLGDPVLGSPDVVPAADQDTGENDRAVVLDPGEAISLGRVDLRDADGLALRLCVAGENSTSLPDLGPLLAPDRLEPPTFLSVRQDGPSGPALIGPIDVSGSLPQELSRLSTLGFGGCYRLLVLPITGRLQEDAPEIFLRAEDGGREGGLRINSVDVTGTGARLPREAPPAPKGMRTIFDGTSFEGWDAADCDLRDGAAVNARTGDDATLTGCSMTYREPLRDVVLRVRMRREDIYDNAGIYLGPGQEIQLRSVGEYLPGGYFGQFAARWQKLSTFPTWDEIEVVQLGARHVVSVNGRTVTDVMREGGPPQPYRLQLVNQPIFSYRVGVEAGFGNEGYPDITKLGELGAFWWGNVRVVECAGPDDPVCRRIADARRGQVPVPEGAPAALPPERKRACRTPRSALVRLPQAGLRRLRATVNGRRATLRRVSPRQVRVRLGPASRPRDVVRVRGRTRDGRTVRAVRTVRRCAS